jgi:hypothetical protein
VSFYCFRLKENGKPSRIRLPVQHHQPGMPWPAVHTPPWQSAAELPKLVWKNFRQ